MHRPKKFVDLNNRRAALVLNFIYYLYSIYNIFIYILFKNNKIVYTYYNTLKENKTNKCDGNTIIFTYNNSMYIQYRVNLVNNTSIIIIYTMYIIHVNLPIYIYIRIR